VNALLYALYSAAIFMPHWGHARAEYPFLAILFLVALRRGAGGALRPIRADIVILALMVLSGILSIIAFNAFHGGFHWRDLMSLVRYPTYAVFLIATAGFPFDERSSRSFFRFIGVIGVVCGTLSVIQYYNALGLNSWFLRMYRDIIFDEYVSNFVLEGGVRRVIGTSGNPNNWAFLLATISLLLAGRIVLAARLRWLPLLAFTLLALLMTGSRSNLIGFLAGLLAMLAVAVALHRQRRPVAAIVGGAAILLVLSLVFLAYTESMAQDPQRFTTDRIGSFLSRIEVWRSTLTEYKSDFLLGRGPNKAARRIGFRDASSYHVRDNIFIAIFAQFGMIGVLLFLALLAVQFQALLRAAREAPASLAYWPIAMIGVLVAWVLYNMTADAFFAAQPATIFLFLHGTTIALTISLRSNRQSTFTSMLETSTSWSGTTRHRTQADA
jgi:O-antigen ligase